MSKFIVLLGPPGAGKGTQAQVIAKELEIPHISSGDIFRENLKNETELGQTAKDYMNRGELVPDDVTIAMIRERLLRPDCANGALLDGFPRTPAQAKALAEMLSEMGGEVALVPYIKVPEKELIRAVERAIDLPGGRAYLPQGIQPSGNSGCVRFRRIGASTSGMMIRSRRSRGGFECTWSRPSP